MSTHVCEPNTLEVHDDFYVSCSFHFLCLMFYLFTILSMLIVYLILSWRPFKALGGDYNPLPVRTLLSFIKRLQSETWFDILNSMVEKITILSIERGRDSSVAQKQLNPSFGQFTNLYKSVIYGGNWLGLHK